MRDKITINDGVVSVPANVQMADFEIAHLFGVTYSAVRGKIATLLKSRRFRDCSDSGVVRRNGVIVPDYFGLDMIIAIAFQIDSYETEVFRKWVLRRLTQQPQSIYINMESVQGNIFN